MGQLWPDHSVRTQKGIQEQHVGEIKPLFSSRSTEDRAVSASGTQAEF